MPGFRRVAGAEHLVHLVELPELSRRRRPFGRIRGTGELGPFGHDGEMRPAGGDAARRLDRSGRPPGADSFGAASHSRTGRANADPIALQALEAQLREALASQNRHQEAPQRGAGEADDGALGEGPGLRDEDVPRPTAGEASARQIELLERRVAKLTRLLEERSFQLQERLDKQFADQGVASVYGETQGLRGDSEEVQRKRDLMSSIFEANQKLRESVGSRVQASE